MQNQKLSLDQSDANPTEGFGSMSPTILSQRGGQQTDLEGS